MNLSCNSNCAGAVDEGGEGTGAAVTSAALWAGGADICRSGASESDWRAYRLHGRVCDAHGDRFSDGGRRERTRGWTRGLLLGQLWRGGWLRDCFSDTNTEGELERLSEANLLAIVGRVEDRASILASAHDGHRLKIDRHGHHKPARVIGMLANQIHSRRSGKYRPHLPKALPM